VMIVVRQTRRVFVERLDFVTSLGYGTGRGHREKLGLTGAGPKLVVTDLGVLEPDPDTCELRLTKLHPGVTVEEATDNTGWPLRTAPEITRTEPPTERELAVLRALSR